MTTIDVGELRSLARAKPGLDPFCAGHHARAPQPDREEHHEEDLVEHRPEPGEPDLFETVNKQDVDQPHGSGDIEHARSVGDAEHPPRERIASEEVGIDVLDRSPGHEEAQNDDDGEVEKDDREIDDVDFHVMRFNFRSTEAGMSSCKPHKQCHPSYGCTARKYDHAKENKMNSLY